MAESVKKFADDMPDCLPLPDKRDEFVPDYKTVSLAVDYSAKISETAASVLYLLGVYSGTEEAGFLIKSKGTWLPLKLDWNNDTSPTTLVEEVEGSINGDCEAEFAICNKDSKDFALIFKFAQNNLTIKYADSLYSEEFVNTMALTWREILLSFPKAEYLSEVRITAPETLKTLDGFNQTVRDYDRTATIVDQFRQKVAEMPDNIAVIYEDKPYTYAEVDNLSDRLANELARQGLGRGDVVSVFINRSEFMVIASLGVLKAGCAYEPLDPNYPDERLAFMVKDAAAKFIVVDDSLVSRLSNFKEFTGKTLCTSKIAALPQPENIASIPSPQSEDLFLLIYTSGTTGVPKGVRLLHRNLIAYAAWYRNFFAPSPQTRITCYNSYGFDGSLTDMYPALTVGAAVVIIPEEKKLDLPALAEIINKHNVSISDLPSQVGRQFALTMNCPSLKYIVGGGEKLVPFKPVYPYIFVNEYGPTEATISITQYSMTEYMTDVPIGVPNDNTAIYIVDSAGRRVPTGALGELWVAGEQVTGGYLNRPEKTAEVFVKNPFSDAKGYETAYRTGDVVRYRMDGNIDFAGRRDGLVKIRGFRVELAEVEGVVHDFPPVKNAAVIACDNPAGGQFIAAYVMADEPIDKDALANFIRERKPPYMVPAAIVQIDSIPRNQNGKLNKKALPLPEIHESTKEYVEPSNEVEAELARGFAAALGMKKVSAAEDFFEAGGDSLSIVRLLSECRDLELNFNIVYEGRTPAGIAELLSQREEIKTREKRDTHFLAPIPKIHYIWGNELEEGFGVHCDVTIYLAPETDLNKLASSVEMTILAHPAVDARLTDISGELRWRQGDLKNLKPQIEKVTREEYETLKKSIRKAMNKLDTRMFNIRLFKIKETDESISKDFYFDFLHPIIDGDSIEIFLQDINSAYHDEKLETEKHNIFDYYDLIEDVMQSESYLKEQEWNQKFTRSFTEHLNELPGDLDPKDENETKPIIVPLKINLEVVDKFTKAQGITDGTLLSAAFGLLQGHRNGEQAGVALTFYNGRDDIRFEHTIGAFYRHYPLCVRWSPDISAETFVKETQENILLCRRHALYEGDPVPFIISFAYQGEDIDDDFEFCGGMAQYEEVEDYEEENFNFYIHRHADDFYAYLTYNTKEYSDDFVNKFMENYAKAVNELASGKKPAEIEAEF